MTKEKATPPERKAALEAIRAEFNGVDGDTQRERLLEALRRGYAVTTFEARRDLDIYYPPARIKELRDDGFKIQTHWQIVTTDAGVDHRVGQYVLETERASNANA